MSNVHASNGQLIAYDSSPNGGVSVYKPALDARETITPTPLTPYDESEFSTQTILTTNATPERIWSAIIPLASNSAYAFEVTCDFGNGATFYFEGQTRVNRGSNGVIGAASHWGDLPSPLTHSIGEVASHSLPEPEITVSGSRIFLEVTGGVNGTIRWTVKPRLIHRSQ